MNYVIWGCSGHAKVVVDIINIEHGKILAFFDNNPVVASIIPEIPIFHGVSGFHSWLTVKPRTDAVHGIIAIGGDRGKDRLKIADIFRNHSIGLPNVVHASSSISPSATLGQGNHVLANTVIAAGSCVGNLCIVNNSANVDHECNIADGVHIAPGTTICGCVSLGANTFIGAGSVVLPRIQIGPNTIVGAGSVVTRNLPGNVVAAGNPSKIIRNNI